MPRPHYAAPQNPSRLERWKSQGGLLGALASILLVLAKIGAPLLVLLSKLKFLLIGLKLLTFGKLLLTFGSMLVSAWFWAKLYGWPFGVGVVLLIFIHECGHALAARLRGIETGIMVFIPLMGAFVTTKRYGRNIVEDAFIGIMGPIVGTLAGVACLGVYLVTHSEFWLALAQWDFLVNLFNLAPTAPLDGGWITPLFSPKLLAVGRGLPAVRRAVQPDDRRAGPAQPAPDHRRLESRPEDAAVLPGHGVGPWEVRRGLSRPGPLPQPSVPTPWMPTSRRAACRSPDHP